MLLLAQPALAEGRYQIQIGSSKNLDGTKYFANKGSRVLQKPTYVIKLSEFYTVLVGDYGTRDEAMAAFKDVSKHYNCMIVNYEITDVVTAYSRGVEVDVDDYRKLSKIVVLPDEPETKTALKPIRKVEKGEEGRLYKVVRKGFVDVDISDCVLVAEQELAEYIFSTKCPLGVLNPFSLNLEEKYNGAYFVTLRTANNSHKVVMEQRHAGKTAFSNKDNELMLRVASRRSKEVEAAVTALKELVAYCAKAKK